MANVPTQRRLIQLEECGEEGQRRVYFENGAFIGEFLMDVDGFWYYWPDYSRRGHWSSHVMRAIADELDEMNKEWQAQIERDLGGDRSR